jgi:translocation and assembly module TamB
MWWLALRRLARRTGRILLWPAVALLLLALPLLALVGSESGSRWIVERGLGMQKMLALDVERGTLLGGLDLHNVVFHGGRFELRIRHLVARWSLVGLFRGQLDVQQLQADDVSLRLTAPPAEGPTRLPTLILPLRLRLASAELHQVSLWRWHAAAPLTLDRVALAGSWGGRRVQVERLLAERAGLGRLRLQGQVRLYGSYPLDATGSLDLDVLRDKGWQPLTLQAQNSVADLALHLASAGPLTAVGTLHLQPLQPHVPYSAGLRWQPLTLPWWPEQALASRGGNLVLNGTTAGLRSVGDAMLSGHHLPAGRYRWRLRSDWHAVSIETLDFDGLGGHAHAGGTVSWRTGLTWSLKTRLNHIDLMQKWPVPRLALPVLSGQLDSNGRTGSTGSSYVADLRLQDGEHWALTGHGGGRPWDLLRPQTADLSWQHVRRQVPGVQAVSSDNGHLSVEGTRQRYALRLDTGLAGEHLPSGRWVAEAEGRGRHVSIGRIDYDGIAGHAGFAGEMDMDAALQWRGVLSFDRFATATWLSPDWSGEFSGQVSGSGQWGSQARVLQLDESHVRGTLRGLPVALDGAVRVVLPAAGWPRASVTGLKADWGVNHLALDGGLEKDWNLTADVSLGDLQQLGLPWPLAGALQGRVTVRGDEQRPDIGGDLKGRSLAWGSLRAATADLAAQLGRLGDAPSHVTLKVTDAATASGRDLGNLDFDLAGTRAAHVLSWRASGATVQGDGRVAGALTPSLSWDGRVEDGHVTVAATDWRLAAPFALGWDAGTRELQAGPHCWASAGARLCNEEPLLLGATGRVRLGLTGLEASRLQDLLPEGLGLTGIIAGTATGNWQPGEPPLLRAELHVDNGKVLLARDEEGTPPLAYDYRHAGLALEADRKSVTLHFGLDSQQMGQAQVDAAINPYGQDKTLQGRLALDGLRLEVMQPFFPGLATLAGAVSASGDLAGTLQRPLFTGAVTLAQGELGMRDLPVNLHNMEARIDVRGTEADISGSTRSGQGQATISGHADWSATPQLDLDLAGQRFELRQEPMLLAEIDPALHLRLVPGRIDLSGTVRVPTAQLNLKPLSDRAVPLSPDVHVVTGSDGARVQVAGAMQSWLINADIDVLLGNEVYFHGYGVNGRLTGGLHLRQQGRQGLEATGEVELDKDSRYDAYGQRLQIRQGRIIFAGNLTQPGLDIEAVREVDSKVVGVRVEGRANAPQATVFSDTPMSQEEIISYLILGRPLTTTDKAGGGNLALAAAAIKLGATGTQGLTSDIGSTLGITDFSLDAEGSGDDTQFTVSGYLSPRLYLRYGVGVFTPVNTATVRYKINASLYLEAVSSLENAIDLFYNFRF